MTELERLANIGRLAIDVEQRRRTIEGARRQLHNGQLGWHSVAEQEKELDAAIAELRSAIPDQP